MNSRKKVLWKIFISTLYLSAFTFGGGYVIVSFMKKKFVDELHWIEEKEMLDLVAIVFTERVRPCAQLRAYNPAGGNPVKISC